MVRLFGPPCTLNVIYGCGQTSNTSCQSVSAHYTEGHKKHIKMCFAITFVKLDGFWTNLANCFLNRFFIKQCKQMSPEPSTSFVLCWNLKVTNTTAHRHTVHGTPSSCYDVKPQTSLDQMSGQRIHQTSIQLTIGSGGWYKTSLSDSNSGHRWSEAAPYLCLGWAEAKRRWKSHWTVAAKAESLHSRKGTTLWTAAKLNIAFSCLTLRFHIFCSVTTARYI